ncbi:MAG TPA: tetratricopeptide repeat protein, partial [Pyrinomonadaceae bacterium]|nr:tetratricopeptide repeat protein [Pyrinomonadaceae bacterium]
ELKKELVKHLKMLEWRELAAVWHDRQIGAGSEWENEIDEHLESADIILLLISPDFIFSKYCYAKEMTRAMERHDAGEARVIPIFLRDVNWKGAPFGKLQGLPTNAKSVTSWPNRDEAFKIVSEGVEKVVEALLDDNQGSATSRSMNHPASLLIPRPPIIGFVARRDADGRDIIERLKEELAPGKNRLVTLSGPGGVGKTTLAAEAARILEKTYQHRLVWSDVNARASFTLSTLLDDIATQLGQPALRTLGAEDKEAQVRALVTDPPALIVLDNYETIPKAERQAIETWLQRTNCSALITSRQTINKTLNIAIHAMTPEEAQEFLKRLVEQIEGGEIFSDDIRQRIYETAGKNPFVMEWIVAQIDTAAQEPDTILEELRHGEGDAAQRVFDRSFNLPQLGDDGRDTLLALSLFTPSATREALAAVAGFEDNMKRVNDAITNLRALWLVKGIDQNRRLTIEGLTRTLARARLSKDEHAAEFKERFIKYFQSYTGNHAQPTPKDYDLLEAEKDNLLRAIDTSFDLGYLESVMKMAFILANPPKGILSVRGYWNEAIWCNEKAMALAQQRNDEGTVAAFAGNTAIIRTNLGEYDEARLSLQRVLGAFKSLNDEPNISTALTQLASIAFRQGDFKGAEQLYTESLEIDRKLDRQHGIALSISGLGNVALEQKEYVKSKNLFEEALKILRDLHDEINSAGVLNQLGQLARKQGKIEEARRFYNESLDIQKNLGNQYGMATTLYNLAIVAEGQGNLAEAERLWRESLSIYDRLGLSDAEDARRNLERIKSKS